MRLKILIIGILMTLWSCGGKDKNAFDLLMFVDLNNNYTTSYKLSSLDTIFCEMKFLDSTVYSYTLLNKIERKKLNELIILLQNSEKPRESFSIGSNQSVLYIRNNKVNEYYISYSSMKNINFRKLIELFDTFQNEKISILNKKDFWNTEDLIEPPGPPTPIDTIKFLQPLTRVLHQAG